MTASENDGLAADPPLSADEVAAWAALAAVYERWITMLTLSWNGRDAVREELIARAAYMRSEIDRAAQTEAR